VELALDALLAQHALSPANALDALNIAATTKAVVVILIMVNAQIAAISKVFKLFYARLARQGVWPA
jgi:hypothetical protein